MAQKCGHLLPAEGDYGVAMVFLPRDEHGVVDARRIFEEECAACGIPLLFWRTVPVDPHDLGSIAQACMPTIMQAFLGRPDSIEAGDEFERALYVCRRSIEKRADAEPSLDGKIFYICSMSARTIVYYAVDYLEAATRAVLAGDPENSALSAHGLDVVVIGGDDTGNDCVGTPAVSRGLSMRSRNSWCSSPAAMHAPGRRSW